MYINIYYFKFTHSIVFAIIHQLQLKNKINKNNHKAIRMRKRQSTITQQYSPTFRKRVGNNYLSLSLPNAKLLVQNERQSPRLKQKIDYQQKLKRAQQYLETSVQNYSKINVIIDMVDEIIRKRMQIHQQSLLSVVKSEINRMQQDCRKIVEDYNDMIDAKNKQTQIYNLKNQVDYFRMEALKLFQSNKALIQQNKELHALNKNKDSMIEQLNEALKKVTKKLMKNKAIVQRKQQAQSFVQNVLLTQQSEFVKKGNIRQQINKLKYNSTDAFQLAKPTNEPLFSYRYSNSKSNVKTNASTNVGNKSNQRRLYTQMSATQTNFQKNRAKNAQIKSKSFWKFEPNPSDLTKNQAFLQ